MLKNFYLCQPIFPTNKHLFFFFKLRLLIANRSDSYGFASFASHCPLSVSIVNEKGGSLEGLEQTETNNYDIVERTLDNGAWPMISCSGSATF